MYFRLPNSPAKKLILYTLVYIVMNILIISGSVRTGRRSHDVAVELQKRFINHGLTDTHILDLAVYNLPVLEEKFLSGSSDMPEGLVEIQQRLDRSDAMVFLSPEYHGSYSGALKNAVDYFWKEFMRKPIGVVAVASGRFGGINASTEMQQLVLSLGAFPMPYKLLIPTVQQAFDQSGKITDDLLSKNFDRFVQEYAWFAEAISDRKIKESITIKQKHD
jgi:NAD(P)H-dependent FMN reductase